MTAKAIILLVSVYFLIINALSSLFAYADKKKAVKDKRRISEKTLVLIGLFGGACGEYLTMKKIHHKTRRVKFMIGLPLEIFLHIIIIVIVIAKVTA